MWRPRLRAFASGCDAVCECSMHVRAAAVDPHLCTDDQCLCLYETPPSNRCNQQASDSTSVFICSWCHRVVHASMSLVMVGREDLVESANFCNLQTLEPDCEGATRQAALTATLIDKINLTAQQQHMVATGSAVYMQLLNSIIQERQRLQSQFAMADSKQASSIASSGRSVVSESSSLEDLFKSRQQLLEAQNKQAARLQLLIRKEMMLRMAGMTWFIGCLSWTQLAKACVLCWPYTLRPSLLCQEIQKRAEAEQSNSSSQQQLTRDQSAAPTSNNAC